MKGAFRPPHDAWSRRDFMRNGSYSIALVCTFGTTSSLKAPKLRHVGRPPRAGAGSLFAPFQRDLPIAPALAPVSTKNGVDVYDVDIKEGLAEILPGFETPIYGYEGIYPGPTIYAAKDRPAIVRQHNNLSFDTNVHLHGGYVPAAHDGHPMDVIAPGRRVRLHVPEQAGRGVPLVPRPRARPHLADAVLRPGRHVPAGRRARGRARAAAGRVRRPAGARRPRVQQGRLVPLRREHRPRLPRRHDPGQRGGLAADGRAAADLPAALPQRVQRALVQAQAGQRPPDAADRLRRRPARVAGRAHGLPAAPGRAHRGPARLPLRSSRARRSCCRTSTARRRARAR